MNHTKRMIRVSIANRQRGVHIDPTLVRRVVRGVLTGEGVRDASISLAFVDDAAIARVHGAFLNDPTPTDVITFNLSETNFLEAELVISGETAARVAAASGLKPQGECLLYVVHGLLHLCGYDDRRGVDRRKMRQREAHYQALLRLPAAAPHSGPRKRRPKRSEAKV